MPSEETTITGAVAALLNSRELVVNRGSNHGVAVGDRVDVGTSPVEIVDPETQQPLGTVSRPLISLVVSDIQGALSVARTRAAGMRNVGRRVAGALAREWDDPRRDVPVHERLILEDEDPSPPQLEGKTLVEVGAPVLIHLGRRIALQQALDRVAAETDDDAAIE